MAIPIFQVDAFTSAPFRGNPAGVCLLAGPTPEAWMQSAAAEMNLAETAFLYPQGDDWRLRWFTPCLEVDLCGHATLASAHILWETGRLAPDATATFATKSGQLTATRRGDRIEMDFPAEPATAADGRELFDILELPQSAVRFAGKNRFDWLIELADESLLRSLRPDFRRLAAVACRGVIVTSRSSDGAFDFVSRFFAPAAGVDEDPVTGSAHCCLAPFWTERLGKDRMVGYQASRRGGVVEVEHRPPRVLLIGQAVTVLKGEWAPAAMPQE